MGGASTRLAWVLKLLRSVSAREMAASLARDMLTMSVAWPSGKRTRYMPAHFGIWLDGGEQTAGDEAQLAILPFQIPPAVNAAQTPIAHCFSSCFRLARIT